MQRFAGLLAAPPGLALLLALLLGGCASTLTTEVTSFHQLSDGLQGQRFVIVPAQQQRDSLEFDSYAGMVRQALVEQGLVAAGEAGTAADLGVSISYEVAGRHSGGRTGTSGFAGFGAASGGFSMGAVGIGISFPIGAVGGGTGDSMVYQRSLEVTIDRLPGGPPDRSSSGASPAPAGAGAAGAARVFEARAISEGPSASLAPVMHAMVQAVFEEFPGPSGQVRVVRSPLDNTP